MTIAANLRINTKVPFPALVQANGPATIAKQNGVFTIGFSISGLSVQVPPLANYGTDYVLVWDSIAKTFLQVSLSTFAGLLPTVYTYVGATPYTVVATDSVLGVDTNTIAAAVAITLPKAASRLNVPLTIKDRSKQAATFNITITPNAGDANGIDGNSNLVISTDGQSVTLLPVNDTVGNGWVRTG